jgi:deoxycytidine triphosphate deaminase
MFVHPLTHNVISHIDDRCNQPNAVDIRVSDIKTIDDIDNIYSDYQNQLFTISDDETIHKNKSSSLPLDPEDHWHLQRGIYEISTPHYVEIPTGFAGYLITRSSLNRNGIFILSGLYDSKFHGYVGCTLYNLGGRIKIKKNTRIAQFILVQAEATSDYNGQYNIKAMHQSDLPTNALNSITSISNS